MSNLIERLKTAELDDPQAIDALLVEAIQHIEELERNYDGAVALLGPYSSKIEELEECVRIGLDYIDSSSVADKFEAALQENE